MEFVQYSEQWAQIAMLQSLKREENVNGIETCVFAGLLAADLKSVWFLEETVAN